MHFGFGGQNLGRKFGKFKNAELHQGLSGFWGDRLSLIGLMEGRANTALIKDSTNKTPNKRSFFVSILFAGRFAENINGICI